jgi:hypothetical protein
MGMSEFRWLLDVGLPHMTPGAFDALHVDDVNRVPGPAGLREANAHGRALVTSNLDFTGPWELPLPHPGIVMFEALPPDRATLERNLRHLEFRLRQYGLSVPLAGNRFLVMTDRTVYRLLDDGRLADMEPWRAVRPAAISAT